MINTPIRDNRAIKQARHTNPFIGIDKALEAIQTVEYKVFRKQIVTTDLQLEAELRLCEIRRIKEQGLIC